MKDEKRIEMEEALLLVMAHFPPHINAEIAAYALDAAKKDMSDEESELGREIREIAEMQVEAAIAIESGNTGIADFLRLIQRIQARG